MAAIKRAMLMSAGLGTRLNPFTQDVPKALIPVMGVPVAQFALDTLVSVGVERITYNYHHHPEYMRAGFERLDCGNAELIASDESQLLMGSAGGLKKALHTFNGEAFYWLNADIISNIDLHALANTHARLVAERGVKMTLVVFPQAPKSAKYREIFLDQTQGLVLGFSTELRVGRPFFASTAILEPDALEGVPSDRASEFVPTVLEPWVRAGKVGFHFAEGFWKDIGSPELWLDAHVSLLERLETGQLPRNWRSRIEMENTRISNQVWMAKKAFRRMSFSQKTSAKSWVAPSYFAGENFPSLFGPRAVYYEGTKILRTSLGSLEAVMENGIGLGAHWSQCVRVDPGI